MAGRRGEVQRQAGCAGQALAFIQQAAADAALAGDLAHAQMRQAPAICALFEQRGAQQAVVEAAGDQPAAGDAGGNQGVGIGVRGQQPGRRIGVDLGQITAVLGAGLADKFDVNRHGRLLGRRDGARV